MDVAEAFKELLAYTRTNGDVETVKSDWEGTLLDKVQQGVCQTDLENDGCEYGYYGIGL